MNGGLGFSVQEPVAHISLRTAAQFEICDRRPIPIGTEELLQLTNSVVRFAKAHRISQGARIEISGGMRTHVGMGSATAIRLGSIEGVARLNGLELARDELIRFSGRGGTSGIGINSYFEGGMICDLGRAADGTYYAPSSAASGVRPPLALPVVEMPPWPLLLCGHCQRKNPVAADGEGV